MKRRISHHVILLLLLLVTALVSAQSKAKEKEQELKQKAATGHVFEANSLVESDSYILAEKEYRKAIAKAPSVVAGSYNLGNTYYEQGNFEEALYRHLQAAENATSKSDKHKAYHNMGNILMKENECRDAVEAFKNALRNDPTDDETRYNLALAQECAKNQQPKKDKEEEKKDENKDDENKDEEQKEDQKQDDPNKDKGDQNKKEGEDKKDDQGKPKDEQDKGKGDKQEDKQQQGKPKPKPGQLSPQQIKNLLKAMNNQEQKVQQKMNAQKEKGAPVRTEKDW